MGIVTVFVLLPCVLGDSREYLQLMFLFLTITVLEAAQILRFVLWGVMNT